MSLHADDPHATTQGDELAALRAELTRLEQALDQERSARARAERALAIKDEFLAVVSHELRAPLGAILGWAHVLHQPADSTEYQRGLQVIEESVQAQSRLIDDLLDMSRMASGRIRLDLQPVDLRALADAVLESMRPAAQARSMAIERRFAVEVALVEGDPTRLRQVLWNLLANALKFTPPGGRIEVWLERDGASWRLSVRDSGCGIPADFLPHVFDRFRQAPATSEGYGGLGLGLAITRHLVELHGGRIEAHSEGPGRGATFSLWLPAAPSAPGQGGVHS